MIYAALNLALLLAASTAEPAVQRNDVRCFLVAAEMADTKDKEVETAGSIMLFYFLGRLDAASPGANQEELITREAERLSEDDKKQLLLSCAAQVEERGKALSTMGE